MTRDELYGAICGIILGIALILLLWGCSVVEKNIYVITSGEVTVTYSTTSAVTTDAEATIPALP